MRKYLKLLRIKQYVKNIFFFLPLIFGGELFDIHSFFNVAIGAVIFSLASSSIYILNDIKDIEEDRLHPKKSKRPIASGEISVNAAGIIAISLVFISLVASFILNKIFMLYLVIYLIMNFLYSIKLKHLPIIDVTIISAGFILRVLSGSILAQVHPSEYLILMTFLISLFIAFAKRYDDINLSENGLKTRKNITAYNKEFVLISMSVLASVNIVSYILYTLSESVINQFHSNYLYLSSFFVILGFLRYFQITFVENNTGSPTELLYKDKFLSGTVCLWLLYFILIIYVS